MANKISTQVEILKEKLENHVLDCGIEISEFEIMHNGEMIGAIDYVTEIVEGSLQFMETYDNPAEYENSKVVIYKLQVSGSLHSTNGRELPNLTAALNALLK